MSSAVLQVLFKPIGGLLRTGSSQAINACSERTIRVILGLDCELVMGFPGGSQENHTQVIS